MYYLFLSMDYKRQNEEFGALEKDYFFKFNFLNQPLR